MPDTMSLSAGVSLGLLAGIVSGVCYLVANGVNWPKSEPNRDRKRCLAARDDGICHSCGGDRRGGFVPCVCHHHEAVKFESGAWFLRQAQRALSAMPWSYSTDKLEQIDEEGDEAGPSDGRNDFTIREFLEALSARLAGGTLEGTRVAPLYDHPAYLPPLRSASSTSSLTQPTSASNAHVQLKRLVARVVEEAAALPALARYAAEPTTPTIESSTYEDLLATAILNKVIERYQHENGSGGRSSGIHSASASPTPSERSSPRSLNSRNTRERDITPPLREEDDVSDWEEGEATDEAVEVPRRVPFPEFGGDIVHATDNEEREFDEVSSSDLQATDGTWEENWLFQKKKIKTIQSVPVPMLVPNSNADYRALIGDRDADDTTDLSDNASDAEQDEPTDYKSDIKRVLESKHVIGGKTKIDESDFEPDSLTIIDGTEEFDKLVPNEYNKNENANNAIINEINDNNTSIIETVNANVADFVDGKDSVLLLGIDSGPLPKTEFNLKEEIHRTMLNGNIDLYNDNMERKREMSEDSIEREANSKEILSRTSTLNHHEREGEYEETVTLPVQRYADSLRRKHFDDVRETPPRNTQQDEELTPGTIAYRERKKWQNCVEMPNNPYSPEAIQKRLSTKSTSSLFDSLTAKTTYDFDEDKIMSEDSVDEENEHKEHFRLRRSSNLSLGPDKIGFSSENIREIDGRSKSPSPKNLKDVLSDDMLQYKRYGRDYYIREAKSSSGCRNRSSLSGASSASSLHKAGSLERVDGDTMSPGLLIQQFNAIATNQQYIKFAGKDQIESITTTVNNNTTEILIEYEDVSDQMLFLAKPAIIDDETDKNIEEILDTAYKTNLDPIKTALDQEKFEEPMKSPASADYSYISSSSLEDSIKIYNVQTGEIVKCKPEDKITDRYDMEADYDIDIVDKKLSGDNFDRLTPDAEFSEDGTIVEDYSEASELDDELSQLPKVKELAKIFVSMENVNEPVKVPLPITKNRRSKENILNDLRTDKTTNKMYMHSLTARSISRQFREELKLSMATPLKTPGGSKEVPEGAEEVTKEIDRPGSPLPEPGTIKTKLAFFESLKSKFSNK